MALPIIMRTNKQLQHNTTPHNNLLLCFCASRNAQQNVEQCYVYLYANSDKINPNIKHTHYILLFSRIGLILVVLYQRGIYFQTHYVRANVTGNVCMFWKEKIYLLLSQITFLFFEKLHECNKSARCYGYVVIDECETYTHGARFYRVLYNISKP